MPSVKTVATSARGRRPVLVNFENGEVKPGEEEKFDAGLYKDGNGEPLVAVTTKELLYTGRLAGNELYNSFLLVHDKKKDELHLVQVDTATVIPVFNKTSKSRHSGAGSNNMSISDLNKQFGSKKAKRVTEQRERLTTNIEAVKEQLEQTVASIKVSEDATDALPTENDNLYRPKINRDASTKEGVYNLEDVVPSYVLDTLINEASSIAFSNSTDLGLSPFVTECISKVLMGTTVETEKIRSITIFLYIHYLIKFINTPMKAVTKKFVVCDKSSEVNQHILDNFSVNSPNGRTRPLHMKDKCLCYIIVLAAIANEYEVNVNSLSKDLKIGIKKAMEISRILAFNASMKNKNVVTLKLPLPPPVSFSLKRKLK